MPQSEVTQAPCSECGGSGWLIAADGGAGRARPCACRERQLHSRKLAAAAIPERYAHCKIEKFVTASPDPREQDQLIQARAIALGYVEQFLKEEPLRQSGAVSGRSLGHRAGGTFSDSGLLFVGPPGVGKTHLAVGVLKELIQRYGVHGRFAEFSSLLHQIQATFDPSSSESKHEVLDPLTEADVLVLDELGSQQATPWVRDILYLIINQRYLRRLPTIFTTNYLLAAPNDPAAARSRPKPENLDRGRDPEAAPPVDTMKLLSSRIPGSLVSRLYEMAQPVELSAVADFRREHKLYRARVAT